MVGAIRRPGAERPDRDCVARESRHPHRSRASGAVRGRADEHALPGASATGLQRRREPRAGVPRGAAAGPQRRGQAVHAVPGFAGRVVAGGPLRSGAALERGGAGAGLWQRTGAARRCAHRGGGRGDQLCHAACVRPATRDRTGDCREFRRNRPDLQAALQARHRFAVRGRADRVAVPAGPGRHPRHRSADRGAGEPDLDPARPQPRTDPAWQTDRSAGCTAHPRGPSVDAARAATGHPAGRAEPGRGQRQHRRGDARCTTRRCRSPARSAARARHSATS